MKRLVTVAVVCSLAVGLGGCASTGTQVAATQGTVNELQAAGPTPQDPNPHGVAVARAESALGASSLRDGIPTPEPAAPVERETRFAGPTPQIPIPVHGGARPAIER